jgi:hypothetical protein
MSKLGAALISAVKPSPYSAPSSFDFYITYERIPPFHNVVGDQEIAHSIVLIIKDNVVEGIQYNLQTLGYLPEFHEYWKNYSIREILLQNGLPDAVLFSKATNKEMYDLRLYYEARGISIEFSGTIKNGNLCPDHEENGIRVNAIFTNPKSDLSLFNSSVDSMDNTDYWKPVEAVLKITKEEFYSQMVATNYGCFVIKN